MLFNRRRADDRDCNPSSCGVQPYLEKVLGDFSSVAEKIAENQVALQVNMAKLTEAVGGIKRVDADLSKLEDKVDKNSVILYKVVGIGMAIAAIAPIVVSKYL